MSINRRADKRVEELEQEINSLMEQTGQPAKPAPVEEESKQPVELDPSEKTWSERYAALRRHSQKVEKDLKDRLTNLETELKNKPTTNPSSLTKEQIKQWADTNPQANAIIRAIAEEQAGYRVNEVQTKVAEIDEINAELSRNKAEAKVRKVHTDFDDVVNSTEFHDWAEKQPAFIQDKIYDNISAEDTIWAISLYKNETKSPNMDKEAARAVKGSKPSGVSEKGKGRFTESMVDKMSPEEYERNEEAIMLEMREDGKRFFDLSGGAR